MESQEVYSDDGSYHSSQDSDYVYDSYIHNIYMYMKALFLCT